MKNAFIHQTAVVDDGAQIGEGSKIWHFCHVMPAARIGQHCILGQNVFVANDVEIGNHCKIQNNVSVYTGVRLEDDVFVGPSAVFTNVINPRAVIERKEEFLETVVGRGATIGANATIVCGTKIGAYALIGAGAVVTKDVKPFAQMVGNPAVQNGWRSEAGALLEFRDGHATCTVTNQRYELVDQSVHKVG